ncbi:uncharacterized protein BX664DRAFT_328324 [Halteromyces radiatus]|uniref:uncharacterized protein n=1 Tax=Halteromyces radiatus TaxID=101107 RepID=UPI002220578E|nr:uncharacterized protein BX664DRAFT_328324 [Halteromyces radiatus]KAI8092858.1 hypothetical protein BX664DRAFT_328324 [Halteromyces radiatus]
MDLKNLLCNKSSTLTVPADMVPYHDHHQEVCLRSPMITFGEFKDNWSYSEDITNSRHSTPSLSSCSSTVSSPTTIYLSHHQQQQRTPATISSPLMSSSSSSPQTRTPWTSSEDFLLQKGYAEGLSWALISSTYLPHRSRGCCWGRFKTLQAKMSEHREWSTTEDHVLLLAIKKHDRLFKQAWKAVAREMGNRNWVDCEMRSFKLSRAVRKQRQRACPY